MWHRSLVKGIFREFQKTAKEKPLEAVTKGRPFKCNQRALSPKALSTETQTLILELMNCEHILGNWHLSFSFFFSQQISL